jgi:hypothetical protein
MVSSLERYLSNLLEARPDAAEIIIVRDDAKNASSCCSENSQFASNNCAGPLLEEECAKHNPREGRSSLAISNNPNSLGLLRTLSCSSNKNKNNNNNDDDDASSPESTTSTVSAAAPPHFPTRQVSKRDLFTVDENSPVVLGDTTTSRKHLMEFLDKDEAMVAILSEQQQQENNNKNNNNNGSALTMSASSAPPRVPLRQDSERNLFTLDEDCCPAVLVPVPVLVLAAEAGGEKKKNVSTSTSTSTRKNLMGLLEKAIVVDEGTDENNTANGSSSIVVITTTTTSAASRPPRFPCRQASKRNMFTLDEEMPLADDVSTKRHGLMDFLDKVITDQEDTTASVLSIMSPRSARWSSTPVKIR